MGVKQKKKQPWGGLTPCVAIPPKTNMTMENPPFEDVFPIENGDFSHIMLVFRGVMFFVVVGGETRRSSVIHCFLFSHTFQNVLGVLKLSV